MIRAGLPVAALAVGCATVRPAPGVPPPAPASLTEVPVALAAPPPETRGECPPLREPAAGPPDFTPVRGLVRELMDHSGTPAVAVAVARDGEVLWEEAFGYADLKGRRKASVHTPFSLASITKPFTATGLMILVERGQVDLQRPIHDYLGDVAVAGGAGDPADATVLRVASHTAGLPLHYHFYYHDRAPRPPPLAETARNHAHLVSPPGERYRYSNLGYGLLDHVLEQASGKPYDRFMRDEVFEPLGLANTSVDAPGSMPRGAAIRYRNDGTPVPDYGFDHDGASAVYSSVHDLVRFGMSHLGHQSIGQKPVLSRPGLARMRQAVAPAEYGIGWGLHRLEGNAAFGHSGGMPGVRTELMLLEHLDVVTVVLANSAGFGEASRIRLALYQALDLPARSDALCRLPLDHPVFGTYEGVVRARTDAIPLTIELQSDGQVFVTLDARRSRLRDPAFEDDRLSGRLRGDLGADQASGPTELELELELRGEVLEGAVTSILPGVAATGFHARLTRRPQPVRPSPPR